MKAILLLKRYMRLNGSSVIARRWPSRALSQLRFLHKSFDQIWSYLTHVTQTMDDRRQTPAVVRHLSSLLAQVYVRNMSYLNDIGDERLSLPSQIWPSPLLMSK